MAGSVIGTPVKIDDGGSYTAEAGSNRVVVIAVTNVWVSGSTSYTVALGSQAFTQANRGKNTGNGEGASGIFYILEADIPAGSNTLAFTYGGTWEDPFSCTIYTLGGIDQTTPQTNEKSVFTSTTTPSDTIVSADNSVCIAASGTDAVPAAADDDERVALDGTTFTQTGWSGAYTDIDDDPDSPDGLWITAPDNNSNTDVLASFGAVTGTLSAGADKQEFKVYVRQFDGGQSGTPQVRIELWESGSLVRAGTAANVNSATGEIHTFTWNKTELTTESGVNAEIKVFGLKSGGSPSARNSVDIGAVEWNAKVEGAAVSWTAPSGWTERRDEADTGSTFYIYHADKTVTTGATETFNPTLPESGSGHIVLANFKPSSGLTVVATTPNLTLAAVDATISLIEDLTVTVTTAALSLATVDATISLIEDLTVTATTPGLTLAAIDATISLVESLTVVADTPNLSLSTVDATIILIDDLTIAVSTAGVAIAAVDATISLIEDLTITCDTPDLGLAAVDATVQLVEDVTVTCDTPGLSITAEDATISLVTGLVIVATTAPVTVQTIDTTVITDLTVTATTPDLTLVGLDATIITTTELLITVTTPDLSVVSYDTTIATDGNLTVNTTTPNLVIAANDATIVTDGAGGNNLGSNYPSVRKEFWEHPLAKKRWV